MAQLGKIPPTKNKAPGKKRNLWEKWKTWKLSEKWRGRLKSGMIGGVVCLSLATIFVKVLGLRKTFTWNSSGKVAVDGGQEEEQDNRYGLGTSRDFWRIEEARKKLHGQLYELDDISMMPRGPKRHEAIKLFMNSLEPCEWEGESGLEARLERIETMLQELHESRQECCRHCGEAPSKK